MLTSLQHWDMKGNALDGEIPTELCKMTGLTMLSIGYNHLDGNIPSCIGDMTKLEVLFLSDNSLHGKLPAQLAELTNLKRLFLDNNYFEGKLFRFVREFKKLELLYLENNSFEGNVNNLLSTEHTQLQRVDMSNNKLTANGIPKHFFTLPRLEILDLSRNEMQGHLPGSLPSNTKLQFLALHDNKLEGPLPTSFEPLQSLTHLDLSDNRFTGPLQAQFGNLQNLTYLFLGNNPNLDAGEIPTSISALTNLQELSLKNTNRSGPLPELAVMHDLVLLDLDQNNLAGAVPDSWRSLTELRYLLLNRNLGVTGDMPSSLQSLSNLQVAYLDGTSLTGDIEFLCSAMKNIQDHDDETNKPVVANCGFHQISHCPCCDCCDTDDSDPFAACSDPMVASIDARWENQFRRSSYLFDQRAAS